MTRDQMTAVVVTRGGRDLERVTQSLTGFGEVLVWNNWHQRFFGNSDLKVYGRYECISRFAKYPAIYTQDDDCIVDVDSVCSAFDTSGDVVCNMTPGHHEAYAGTGIALVGHGAVFARQDVSFYRYLSKYPMDELFLRECDRVFTYLTRDQQLWTKFSIEHLEHAHDPETAMWKEQRHGDDLVEIKRRLATI